MIIRQKSRIVRHPLVLSLVIFLTACQTYPQGDNREQSAVHREEQWIGFASPWESRTSEPVIFVVYWPRIEEGEEFCAVSDDDDRHSLIRDLSRPHVRALRRTFVREQQSEQFRLAEVRITGRRFEEQREYFYPTAHIGVPYTERVELTAPLELTGRSCVIDFRTDAEKKAGEEEGPETEAPDPS